MCRFLPVFLIFKLYLYSRMKKTIIAHWPAITIFLLSLVIGLLIFPDYGLSIDEDSQRGIDYHAYEYVMGRNPDYVNFIFRDHSPGFEWPLIFLEKILGVTEYRNIFLMRHIASYGFFLMCMMVGYALVYQLFKNKLLACIALIALIYNPVLFAHSFFNPKDIPALCMIILCIAAAYWAFNRQKYILFFLFGLVCGYGGCVRLMNLVILVPVALLFLIDLVAAIRAKEGNAKRVVLQGITYLCGICIALYVSWPALWVKPIDNLILAYNSYAKFDWVNYVLFNGERILSTKLPWTYIPVSFGITTPELWILLGIAGMVLFAVRCVIRPSILMKGTTNHILLLSFLCFVLPVAMVIITKPVLYDSWRHMFFIYPPFIIMAAYALNEILKTKARKIMLLVCGLQMIILAQFMIKNHPFQQVYFNHFVSHEKDYLYNHYELDYWAVCNKQALEWLANYTDEPKIKINHDGWQSVVYYNLSFLDNKYKERFILTADKDHDQLDYYVEYFRTQPFKQPSEKYPDAKIIHEQRVLNSPIYRIVKMR